MNPDDYAAVHGATTGDTVRLGDTGLVVRVEADSQRRGGEFLLGFGKTARDGMHLAPVSLDQSCDLVVSNVLILDPVLGCARPRSASARAGSRRSAGRATRTPWTGCRSWSAPAPRWSTARA